MPEDLRTLLRDAAATPSRQVDPVRVHAVRVRRQILTWLVAVSVTAVAAVVVVPAVFERPPRSPIVEQPSITPTEPAPSPTTDPDSQWPPSGLPTLASVGWPAGPSQTSEAAARDRVIAEIAALPLGQRIGVVDAAATTEGVWVVSRTISNGPGDDLLGDPSGVYGRDYVSMMEYGEILLLDPDTFEIRRAWPLPGLPPSGANAYVDRLVVTDQAVYVAHQGDGALPDSWVARIDRASLADTIRVFPADPGFTADDPRLDAWDVDVHERAASLQQGIVVTDRVVALGYDGTVLVLHPDTLEPVDEFTVDGRPAPGPEGTLVILDDADHIVRFVDAADPTVVVDLPAPDIDARFVEGVAHAKYGTLLLLAGEHDWILARRLADGWEQVTLPGPGPDDHAATLDTAGGAAFVLYDDVVVDVSAGVTGRYVVDWSAPELSPDENGGPRPAITDLHRGSLVEARESQTYLLIGPHRFVVPTLDGAPLWTFGYGRLPTSGVSTCPVAPSSTGVGAADEIGDIATLVMASSTAGDGTRMFDLLAPGVADAHAGDRTTFEDAFLATQVEPRYQNWELADDLTYLDTVNDDPLLGEFLVEQCGPDILGHVARLSVSFPDAPGISGAAARLYFTRYERQIRLWFAY